MLDLNTTTINTWCPGCPNFGILASFKQAVNELIDSKSLAMENLVIGSGVGCHAKISDDLNVNSFYSLHGRVIPTMTGVKLANPNLNVVAFTGDGDSLSEGIEHLIHAAKRNSDIKLFLHNNQVFALTTGQFTATSLKGYKGRTTPEGSVEEPLNPLAFLLSVGATFLARSYAMKIKETADIMKAAMLHKGFGLVEIIQPCITFNDTREYFQNRLEWLPVTHDASNYKNAYKELTAQGDKLKCGIFYQVTKPSFEEQV